MLAIVLPALAQTNATFQPGKIWPDNNGVHINAHGGGILYYAGKFPYRIERKDLV